MFPGQCGNAHRIGAVALKIYRRHLHTGFVHNLAFCRIGAAAVCAVAAAHEFQGRESAQVHSACRRNRDCSAIKRCPQVRAIAISPSPPACYIRVLVTVVEQCSAPRWGILVVREFNPATAVEVGLHLIPLAIDLLPAPFWQEWERNTISVFYQIDRIRVPHF